jgi:hypothetical protein
MSTIVLWNDENRRYEKWVVKREGIEVSIIGGEE